jgi:hypothetical protein
MDDQRFINAQEKALSLFKDKCSIGVYCEKKLHSILKFYIEPDQTCHECSVSGYVADIFRNNQIYEIQTSSLNKLRKKLDTYLDDYHVTIVFPIAHNKWLYWIDEENGEITKKRKSPKRGTYFDCISELYKIKMYLRNKNLSICLILTDIDEYRLLNGWSDDKKKGSSRHERIPVRIENMITLSDSNDYKVFLPSDIDKPFTSKQYSKSVGITLRNAQILLNILSYISVIKKIGKLKNSYLYEIND